MWVGKYRSMYREMLYVTTSLESLLKMVHEDKIEHKRYDVTWTIKFDPNEKTARTLRLS